ncbi:MAG: DNA (cytosine-5-)-methyltransferase [Muribaculaceae bacterium]|nr:DNA (cytosine-5-)-methyltransferase [Muribaculaceae bacterium]
MNTKSYKTEISVFEAFAGYGSQQLALSILSRRYPWLKFSYVGISEIDKWAIKAYQKLYGTKIKNYGDISKIEWGKVSDFMLFTYSFPCQDITNSGNKTGFEEGSGTRSSLLWECKKAIIAKRPKYLLMENVKNIKSPKFEKDLEKWKGFLKNLGYNNYEKVLDARDFGIPQHRERYFLVSILGSEEFEFPIGMKLKLKPDEMLDKNVANKFYIEFNQAA